MKERRFGDFPLSFPYKQLQPPCSMLLLFSMRTRGDALVHFKEKQYREGLLISKWEGMGWTCSFTRLLPPTIGGACTLRQYLIKAIWRHTYGHFVLTHEHNS